MRTNLRCMRANLWSGQNQAGIAFGNAITRITHPFQRLTQKDNGICTLPPRIGGRKQRSNVRSGNSPQQRVGNSVQQDVTIGMSAETLVVRQSDTANLERNVRVEFMRVEPVTDS